ncbi:MAG: nucleoside deaminase [Acidobacteria bacterium]|nr:nucleoside deaminase [Acidobacteriota bacterium]
MDEFLAAAIEEARRGLAEGGIPIGSVLVMDGRIVGRGHNRRVQRGSAVFHAEMDCLENAGRLKASDYRRSTLKYDRGCPYGYDHDHSKSFQSRG